MRQIKFRAWDKDIGMMRAWEDESSSSQRLGQFFTRSDFTLMQFTGLLDKNGKECFEGDIVRRVYEYTKANRPKDYICEIRYSDNDGAFVFYHKHKIGEGWSRMYGGHKVWPWEIIGNIYENPELLK